MAAVVSEVGSVVGPTLVPRGGSRLHAAVAVAVLVVSIFVLGYEAAGSPFEADEADYVATSRYFGYLFLQHNVSRKEWDSNHWTRTQPPFTRYVVGAWLTLNGYDLEKLNQPYVSTASSFEVNRQKGRVPTDDVLATARRPMVLLGAGAVALLYLLGVLVGGWPAGLLTAALALSSPFMRYTLIHVWAEAPLALLLLLSVLLAAHGLTRMTSGRRAALWALALGVSLGLTSATKLTGLVAVALTAALGCVLALWLWRRGDAHRAGRVGVASALAVLVAALVFVAVNPYLWRGPAAGLQGMLEERRDEMAFQQDQWPEYAVLGWQERPWLTFEGSVQVGPLAETPLAALVNLPLLAFGIVALVRRLGRSGPVCPSGVLVAWVLGYVVVVMTGLGLKYPRYFMPTTLLLLPFVALGMVTVARLAWRGGSRARGRLASSA